MTSDTGPGEPSIEKKIKYKGSKVLPLAPGQNDLFLVFKQ